MISTKNKKFRDIPHQTGLAAIAIVGLFGIGIVFSYLSGSLGTGALAVAFVLALAVALLTGWQAWANGSVIMSILISLAVPLGFWIGMRTRDAAFTAPASWRWLHLTVTIGLAVGLAGHLIGMEIGRRNGTGAREASDIEQLLVAGLWLVVLAVYFVL